MALDDVLPDRPLSLDEMHQLQAGDTFDSVTTAGAAEIDTLFLKKGDSEWSLLYTDESGWHPIESDDG